MVHLRQLFKGDDNMKNFLKRANRGLILGAIVLVGFVAFVIADTAAFKKNKPQIETAVTDYLDALSECAVTSPSKEEFQKKADKLMADYWCSGNSSGADSYYGLNISNFRNELKTVAEETYSGKNENEKVTKWSAKPYNLSITKAGANYAKVSFSCDIVAEFQGDPYLVTPCEMWRISDYLYSGNELNDNPPSKFSLEIDYEFNMKETDGKWKVCSAESWGWCEPTITVLDETEGGNE